MSLFPLPSLPGTNLFKLLLNVLGEEGQFRIGTLAEFRLVLHQFQNGIASSNVATPRRVFVDARRHQHPILTEDREFPGNSPWNRADDPLEEIS